MGHQARRILALKDGKQRNEAYNCPSCFQKGISRAPCSEEELGGDCSSLS